MFLKGTDCDFCVLLDASYDTFTLRNVVAPYAFVARNQLTSNQPKSRVTQELNVIFMRKVGANSFSIPRFSRICTRRWSIAKKNHQVRFVSFVNTGRNEWNWEDDFFSSLREQEIVLSTNSSYTNCISITIDNRAISSTTVLPFIMERERTRRRAHLKGLGTSIRVRLSSRIVQILNAIGSCKVCPCRPNDSVNRLYADLSLII